MTRDELLFQIRYSTRLEKMQAQFLARVDRASSFLQILLGMAVIAAPWPVATGLTVSVLAAFSFVYQPGSKAVEARAQKQKYEKLAAGAHSLSDEDLRLKFAEIQEGDSQVIGSLENPAHWGECIRLGRDHTNYELTKLEKVAAFIAGDLQRRTTYNAGVYGKPGDG